jgi:hypothetical protein
VIVIILILGIVYFTHFSITPTDTRIIQVLEENRDDLLSVVGVVGAGIARDENNHIIGIAVYVDDEIAPTQQLPGKLGDFDVFVKRISEVSDFEKERMILRNAVYQLLNVTTDKTVYHQNDNMTITVKNDSNETLTFGNSVYGLFFQKWNGGSWKFYTGVIGLEVLTYLDQKETADVNYRLGDQIDNPFPTGKYRVVSTGWLDNNGQTLSVWGYAEFTVE